MIAPVVDNIFIAKIKSVGKDEDLLCDPSRMLPSRGGHVVFFR